MGRLGSREVRTSRIQRIDIHTQIHGLLRAHPRSNPLNNPLSTNSIDFPRLHDLKSAVSIVVVIGETGKGGTDAGVDVGVVCEEALGMGVVEVCAVVDGGLGGGGAAEDAGAPCVAVDCGFSIGGGGWRMGGVDL